MLLVPGLLLAGCRLAQPASAPGGTGSLDCAAIASRIADERGLIADLAPSSAGTEADNPMLGGHQELERERRDDRARQDRAAARIASLQARAHAQGCMP